MFGIIGVEKSPGTVATYCKRFPGTQKNQPLKMSIMILFPRKKIILMISDLLDNLKKEFVLYKISSCKKQNQKHEFPSLNVPGKQNLKF